MDEDASVAVAGAGPAGLVAASRLAESGADVTVYERRSEIGGRVRSREVERFTLDRGFQTLFTAYPAVRRELDLDALDLRPFAPGACIARPGRRSLLSDPLRDRDPRALAASALTDEVTVSDKLRTLALVQDLRSRDPESFFSGPDATVRDYLLDDWGFSKRYVENFVAPFYGGITLDRSLSTSKRVFEYTFRALADGAAAVPADGMGAITRQLDARARRAGATVRTGEAVEAVDAESDGARVETAAGAIDADAAVVAADPRTARELTGVDAIPTEAVGCVTQQYRLPGGVDLGTGRRLLLDAAGVGPNTVVPISTVAPEYAPAGSELLSATFLGEDAREATDEELADRTRGALSSWYPEREFAALDPLATDRIPFAQFAQPPGVHERLPDVDAPGGRAYLAGEFTEWSSIQGAMESGRKAAAAVLAAL